MSKRIRYASQSEHGMTKAERDWLLDQGWASLAREPSEARQRELWATCSDDLLAEYRQNNGMFCRPCYWWSNEAPEPRERDEVTFLFRETEAVYLERHPELLTRAEKEHLSIHGLTRWQRLPASEWASIESYQRSENWRALLHEDELSALNEHLSSMNKESIP